MTHPQTPLPAHDGVGAGRERTASSPLTGNGVPGEVVGGLLAQLTAKAAAWDETAADLTANHPAVGEGCPIAAFRAQGRVTQLGDCADELRAALATPDPALTITVLGTPAPQGSKRHVGRGVMIESSKKVKPWREAVKTAAADLVSVAGETGRLTAGFPLDGPLLVEFAFTFARTKGHYRTGRNAHLLRDTAPAYPAVMPDLSKLIRSTEDACTDAGVWADDARIVRYRDPRKVYAGSADPDALSMPGAVIRIWEVTT